MQPGRAGERHIQWTKAIEPEHNQEPSDDLAFGLSSCRCGSRPRSFASRNMCKLQIKETRLHDERKTLHGTLNCSQNKG